jgi:hypothetical protein
MIVAISLLLAGALNNIVMLEIANINAYVYVNTCMTLILLFIHAFFTIIDVPHQMNPEILSVLSLACSLLNG